MSVPQWVKSGLLRLARRNAIRFPSSATPDERLTLLATMYLDKYAEGGGMRQAFEATFPARPKGMAGQEMFWAMQLQRVADVAGQPVGGYSLVALQAALVREGLTPQAVAGKLKHLSQTEDERLRYRALKLLTSLYTRGFVKGIIQARP